MKVTKSMRFAVRVREFETVHVEIGAEADHHDLGWNDEQLAAMQTLDREGLRRQLEKMVEEEVDTLTTRELSVVSTWADHIPNVADDYLESRSKDARTAQNNPQAQAGRRLRRTTHRTPPL